MIYFAWVAWLIAGILAVVAFRRSRADGEAGWLRLASIASFIAATAVIMFGGAVPSGKPVAAAFTNNWLGVPAPSTQMERAQAKAVELHKQLDQVDRQIRTLSSPTPSNSGGRASPGPAIAPGTRPTIAPVFVEVSTLQQSIVLGVLLTLVTLNLILLLASIGSLTLPGPFRRASREEQKAKLADLAKKIWDKDYRGAAATAAEINELKLSSADQVDLFYLRSYAAMQVYGSPQDGETPAYRQELLDHIVSDLDIVVSASPRHAAAQYLFGLTLGFKGEHEAALEHFAKSRNDLKGLPLPFDHNESVCLLHQAEGLLGRNEVEQAERCFDQVIGLGKLSNAVIPVKLNIAMGDLAKAVRHKATDSALEILKKITALPGLDQRQRTGLDVIRIGLTARTALAGGDAARAAHDAGQFIAQYLPTNLPPANYDVADDLFSPVEDDELDLPRAVYRDLLFNLAIARAMIETSGRTALTQTGIDAMAEPLLRGLQIEPRHRDLLAALGGLCYWTQRDMRARARDWIDGAVTMGLVSRYARMILVQDQAAEERRRDLMGLFRTASARLLRDPTLAEEMRRVLVTELGRFQEFEPLLMDLRDRINFEPEEPTVATLRDRARYVSSLVAESLRRNDLTQHERLLKFQADYDQGLQALERSIAAIQAVERSVVVELSSSLALI